MNTEDAGEGKGSQPQQLKLAHVETTSLGAWEGLPVAGCRGVIGVTSFPSFLTFSINKHILIYNYEKGKLGCHCHLVSEVGPVASSPWLSAPQGNLAWWDLGGTSAASLRPWP